MFKKDIRRKILTLLYVFKGILSIFNRDLFSQKLGNDTEMSLFQVLKAWEFLVEVLGQVEHFLRDIKNLIFSHSTNLDQSGHNLGIDKVFFL